ncbi:MAG: hypothetical protein COV30_01285 [Candidatus Yanofskybacteria bacterium CG10_big_fil_rev_8_21_14_0_10_37_15]|uniref:dTDP-4-dehydrorhamnose reductase n=1 Tax=Candidatus Yanofskybacteria bacterium CG10_big_fil_rev_8_21_14_0_10_37_15 TaxID=1975097 RepID=A0A2H0R5K9_9BACT|nr:MAG: hypothetical protein COV30_01285 [Candidatus Yanofskybacteria bacterium CG10_big_fil_rev_8_21_14_0_10_37_15]
MNQVIITGASGLLGSQIVETFKVQGYEVLAVFNQRPDLIAPDVEKINCDISDKMSVLALRNRIESSSLIINCAAVTNVDLCEREKELCEAVNVRGTRNICDLVRLTGSKIIQISTASVFDGKKGNYKETDKVSPINFHNLSKAKGEDIVLDYERGVVIRSIPLGLHLLGRESSSFLEWLIDSLRNNKDINLYTDVRINPLSVSSAADVLIKASILMERGVLHIGSKNVVSKSDIGLEVVKFFPEYKGKITMSTIDQRSNKSVIRPKEMWLNIDKALSMGLEFPEALSDINEYLITRLS